MIERSSYISSAPSVFLIATFGLFVKSAVSAIYAIVCMCT